MQVIHHTGQVGMYVISAKFSLHHGSVETYRKKDPYIRQLIQVSQGLHEQTKKEEDTR